MVSRLNLIYMNLWLNQCSITLPCSCGAFFFWVVIWFAMVMDSQLVDLNRFFHNTCNLNRWICKRKKDASLATQRLYRRPPTIAHTHTHTHTAHNTGSPQRGKHVPIVRGSHEPPCSFSPDNSCIDNTYQLVRYKRRGRRHRKGTKRNRRKRGSQPVNGYPFTSLPCGTFFHIRTAKSCVGATFSPLIRQKR